MTGRPIIQPLQEMRDYDFIKGWADAVKGDGDLAQFLLGRTPTLVSRCDPTATAPTSMSVRIAPGAIGAYVPVDVADYGEFPPDTDLIYQIGVLREEYIVNLNTTQLSSGQSQFVLIQAEFFQYDQIRLGDPDGGIVRYVNLADVTNPYVGQNNSGLPQNTVRMALCKITTRYGTPASSNPVAPQPNSDCVGLYLIELSHDQLAVAQGDIMKAGDAAYAGYPEAPIFKGILNPHHHGGEAEAPPINLYDEVQGRAANSRLMISSDDPTGGLCNVRYYHGDPNGHLAGQAHGRVITTPAGNVTIGAPDMVFDDLTPMTWYCTFTGPATGGNGVQAVWTQLPAASSGGGGGGGGDEVTFPLAPAYSVLANLTDHETAPLYNQCPDDNKFFGRVAGVLGWYLISDASGGFGTYSKKIRIFPNSTTYTPTAGTQSVSIQVIGGGGGGGGVHQGGGGGGAGGDTIADVPIGLIGASATISVGAGGAGGAGNTAGPASPGGAGGTTTISNSNFSVSSGGGSGGGGGGSTFSGYGAPGLGGNGGSGSSSGTGVTSTTTSQKGKPAIQNGGPDDFGGDGGSTSKGAGGAGGNPGSNGSPGSLYGGGGGGGGAHNRPGNGGGASGGAGAKGVVIVTETILT